MTEGSEEYVYLADTADGPADGKSQCYSLNDRSVLLCHAGGKLYAVENQCSHERKPLEGGRVRSSGKVVCPIHGATFDLETGKALNAPAVLPIAAFPMKIEDDKIYIKLVPMPKPPKNPFGIPGM